MFYFAHPFGGIATPASASYSINGFDDDYSIDKMSNNNSSKINPIGWCDRMHCKIERDHHQQQQEHVHEYVPWPQETWICDDVLLQPLIMALREQFGE